ncbi:MAG: cyclic nucleotide-binding/CBS domain-containing protein [Candidatus Heimdallarchaeota archaeon]
MASKRNPVVRDLTIDDEFEVINAQASIKEAAAKMKEGGIPDLVVVDDNDQVLGIIADFDIVTNVVAEGLSTETAKVTEVMYTIESVNLDTPVETAFKRMRDLDVSVIPVIDKDKLAGVATITDCWGMLPEKYEDQRGLIAVSNPRFANYAFSTFFTFLYFFLGIAGPLVGMVGYLKAPIAGSAVYTATYYLFEARGGGFWIRYWEFTGDFGLLWLGLALYGVIFIVLGLLGAFLVYYWAQADYNLVKTGRNWGSIGLMIGTVNIVIEWILFFIIMSLGALRVPGSQITFDVLGVIVSVLAIVFLVLAVSRDLVFRDRMSAESAEEA